jgi:MscS family membrane protein
LGFLDDFIGYAVAGVPLGRMGAFAVLAALSLLVRKLAACLIRKSAGKGEGIPACFLRQAARPVGMVVFWGGLYVSLKILGISPGLSAVALKLFLFLVLAGTVWIVWILIDSFASRRCSTDSAAGSRLDNQMVPVLRKLAKILVGAMGAGFFLQMLGYPLSGIIAGLGIGGLAVALAAQDSLSGFFSSIILFMDKPFRVGDFVQIGSTTGTVSEIGLRSTRIRTVGKTLVSIPNKEVVDSIIDNLSERPMRRTEITVGVTYGSTPAMLESLLASLRKLLLDNPDVDDETIIVFFTEFGSSSLNIEMKFFVKTTDFVEWLRIREEINLSVMRAVSEAGMQFAFPTQTIHMGG